jgi:hypothetical protein
VGRIRAQRKTWAFASEDFKNQEAQKITSAVEYISTNK